MTKERMLAAAGAVVLTLGLGAGLAVAQTDPASDTDAMHTQMHSDMPEEMQAQCDTMHARAG